MNDPQNKFLKETLKWISKCTAEIVSERITGGYSEGIHEIFSNGIIGEISERTLEQATPEKNIKKSLGTFLR